MRLGEYNQNAADRERSLPRPADRFDEAAHMSGCFDPTAEFPATVAVKRQGVVWIWRAGEKARPP
jgi:hypothetical protein